MSLAYRYPQPTPVIGKEAEALTHIRIAGLGCRSKARADIFYECYLLTLDKKTTHERHLEALLRGWSEAIGQRPVLFQPGETELSFDEAWVLQLLRAMNRNDMDSVTFLIRSRVAPAHRRNVAFLVAQVAQLFSAT